MKHINEVHVLYTQEVQHTEPFNVGRSLDAHTG